jgi:hypothetical protein
MAEPDDGLSGSVVGAGIKARDVSPNLGGFEHVRPYSPKQPQRLSPE